MYCSDCGKFVSHSFEEPDEFSVDLGEDSIEGEVHLALTCQECNNELAYLDESFTIDYPEEAAEHFSLQDGAEHSPDSLVDSWSVEDFYRPRKNPGKYIKGPKAGQDKVVPLRFQTHYYKVDYAATVTCTCGKTFEMSTIVVEAAASDFEKN